MLKALKRGKTCGFLVDLTLKLDQPGHVIEAFGMKKYVTGVHVTLATLSGARLVPVTCLPIAGGRYDFHFYPDPTLPFPTRAHASLLGSPRKTHPGQTECWLWNYKHWRYRPDGAENYPSYAQSSGKFRKSSIARKILARGKTGDVTGRPCGLEIVAAGNAVDVENLPGKE